jgi:hypothetical protein
VRLDHLLSKDYVRKRKHFVFDLSTFGMQVFPAT